ncbi:nucleotidyltransferase family protein [Paenibacillus sp. sptzw28]|nr:nucleotidyltransferase family protein [Paenibacillus sp. sptzw28]
MLENRLKQYLSENEAILRDLRLVRGMNLPQCFIGAGYIRSYIWDRLHGITHREIHNDIDVVYYDTAVRSEDREKELELELIRQTGNPKWSVKNQARMHVRNDENPYGSTEDAISRWPETVTAIGARINEEGNIEICAPYGLDDLFNMIVRRSPLFKNRHHYLERIAKKDWKKNWPLITIVEE